MKKFDLVLKGGIIVTPVDEIKADLVIQNEKIVGIVQGDLTPPAEETLDVSGKVVMPGGVDTHTHLREPGFEYTKLKQPLACLIHRTGDGHTPRLRAIRNGARHLRDGAPPAHHGSLPAGVVRGLRLEARLHEYRRPAARAHRAAEGRVRRAEARGEPAQGERRVSGRGTLAR